MELKYMDPVLLYLGASRIPKKWSAAREQGQSPPVMTHAHSRKHVSTTGIRKLGSQPLSIPCSTVVVNLPHSTYHDVEVHVDTLQGICLLE